jgi:UDP-N-acetylglucosamine--N-acetylmuramyl-(pentapeptide) pyrophosphoryl-undecaprenol N-acetylglucosamine transferase
VLEALGNRATDILWVGVEGGMENELVTRAGVSFQPIPAAGLHGVGILSLPKNSVQLVRGWRRARALLSAYHPDVLFFTGGYVAVPVALAGHQIPTAMYVPDTEPALALKVVSRFADQVMVTTEVSRRYFKDQSKVVVTGYPLRPELAEANRRQALVEFGLAEDLPVILVTGGSLGARSVNRALHAILPELLKDMQVLHITGRTTWHEFELARANLDKELAANYLAFDYLHSKKMAFAFACADLAVTRAGASSLGELPYFGLPAILVPYPHAWRYQKLNAAYLADNNAAVVLPDEMLEESLLDTILEIMKDGEKRAQMSEAMRSLSVPTAAEKIADQLFYMAGEAGKLISER